MQDQKPESRYLESFARFEATLDGEAASPVHQARRDALAKFAAMGFPTTRQEEWRFTNVTPIVRGTFDPLPRPEPARVAAGDVARFAFAGQDGPRVVFVNGVWSPEQSSLRGMPAGLTIRSLNELLASPGASLPAPLGSLVRPGESAFTALNTAFLREGVLISLEEGAAPEQPVQVLYLSDPSGGAHAAYPRTVVVAGAGSRLMLVEVYAGLSEGEYLTNAVTEIVVGPHAHVESLVVEQHPEFRAEMWHLARMRTLLHQVSGDRRACPCRIVEPTIQNQGLVADGLCLNRAEGQSGLEPTVSGVDGR